MTLEHEPSPNSLGSNASYFAARTSHVWTWGDDGEVVVWTGGATIAFRAELEVVLERLTPQGLPPFGAVVLLLGACRRSWSEQAVANHLRRWLTLFPPSSGVLVHDVMNGLDLVHTLRDLVQTPAAVAELAAMVFERSIDRHVSGAKMLAALREGLTAQDRAECHGAEAPGAVLRDLGALRPGLLELTRTALEQRLATGLEALPSPAPIEMPPAGAAIGVRRSLEEWMDDPELGGVARLARLLLAALQLPRPLDDPDELPMGGIADISNRGPLDRLMLSELAYDDLTLAARVAMNEALYLRREPLARPQSRQRFLLLDSGVRLWGVPRVFATAVALAAAAQAGPLLEVTAWRAAGERLAEVDLGTPSGVTAHLAALETYAHPGEALDRFGEIVEQAGGMGEAMLITCDDVLADPEFVRALDEAPFQEVFLALVARDGQFRLLRRTRGGTKVLREARFDLNDVLEHRRRGAQSVQTTSETDLPAIFHCPDFPLRLPYPVNCENSASVWGVLTYTTDGRLLHWNQRGYGPRQLAEGLPPGRLHLCRLSPDGETAWLVVGKLSSRGLYSLTYHLSSGARSCVCLNLPSQQQPQRVLWHEGVILVRAADSLTAVDPGTGRLLDWARVAGRGRGRIVARSPRGQVGADDWVAFACDGENLVSLPAYRHTSNSAPLVEVLDHARGLIGLTALGELVDLATDRRTKVDLPTEILPCDVVAESRDGERIALAKFGEPPHSRRCALVELASSTVLSLHGAGWERALERPLFDWAKFRNLRNRFTGIGVLASRQLALLSAQGDPLPLTVSAQPQALILGTPTSTRTGMRAVREFAPLRLAADRGYSLSEAHWADGSRAILDSRGLLHLRSGSAEYPEITIVLAEGTTAGWTSRGTMWGPAYFTGIPQLTPVAPWMVEILERLIERLS